MSPKNKKKIKRFEKDVEELLNFLVDIRDDLQYKEVRDLYRHVIVDFAKKNLL